MIVQEMLKQFEQYLIHQERSHATVEKYMLAMRQFISWCGRKAVTKEVVAVWKEYLLAEQYHPSTINGKIAALNMFFRFAGWEDCCIKSLRLQRRMFRDASRDLTRNEYQKLVATAEKQGKHRLSLVLQTICSTGIRVSELNYVTVEAAKTGQAEVKLKGKIRVILLPNKLCRKLLKYAGKKKIASGEIFLTRDRNSLSRKTVWAEMKALCNAAGIEASKVFPHNLRHLFARAFYASTRDVAKLADVLGHSSLATTRIYLISTGAEHVQQLNQLRLVI